MTEPGDGPPEPQRQGALRVRGYTGGAFAENTYLIHCEDTGRGVVVDPGAATRKVLDIVDREQLRIDAVFLTHAHLDHVEGLPDLREVLDVPIHLHPADFPLYERAADQAAAFGMRLAGTLPDIDVELVPGTAVPVGRCELEVRFTPGHAPGHVIFHSPSQGLALVGDVVFRGSIGRTDLPGGDMQQLLASIRREILTLSDATRLYTGHGPETTVERERMGNPFLVDQAPGERA